MTSRMFPPTREALIAVYAHMAVNMRKSFASVRKTHFAIASAVDTMGLDSSPCRSRQVELLLRAIRKQDTTVRRPRRVPITVWILDEYRRNMDKSDHTATQGFAAAVVGVFGLLRAGEFVTKPGRDPPLLRSDVAFRDDGCAVLHLRASKTDIWRKGVDVVLAPNGTHLCPVTWIKVAMGMAGDCSPDAPAFQAAGGKPYTYTMLQKFLKTVCVRVGIDPSLCGTHSLRIGGASSMAMLGMQDSHIKAMGRWDSVCYQLYTQLDVTTRLAISKRLAEPAGWGQRGGFQPFAGIEPAKAIGATWERISSDFRDKNFRDA